MSAAGSPAARPSLEDLKAELADRAEELALALLGPPNKDTVRRAEWRWGGKGSVAFFVRDSHGKTRGSFFNNEAGTGGSPLDFIMDARGCGIAEAVRWASHWLGHDQTGYTPQPVNDAAVAERVRKQAAREREAATDQANRVQIARKLWDEAVPVAGTIAERYLVETRRIPMPPLGWSSVVRFHLRSRALIVAATLASGEVQAVQRVFLTPDGQKVGTDEIERRQLRAGKVTNGATEGAVVRLPARTLGARPNAPLLLVEGPETGLSAWISTGHECWIVCGGIRATGDHAVPLELGRRVVLCRDDDRRFSPADNTLRKTIATWRSGGHAITVATPWRIRRFDKSDLNDTLQTQGTHGVQARIEWALRVQSTAVRREPIEMVRQHLDEVIRRFFDEAATWGEAGGEEGTPEYAFPTGDENIPGEERSNAPPPPAHAVKVEVGAGKSRSAYRHAAAMLARMRAAGDNRAIAVAVPTHKLGDEHAAIFETIANPQPAVAPVVLSENVTVHTVNRRWTARVWRGMEAVDPDHQDAADPDVPVVSKTRMCRNLDAVKDAREAGADLFKSACQRKVDGERVSCPFFSQCGYQRQREATADIWIIPHELLFLRKPASLGRLAALVVDESCWADGLEGVHGKPSSMPLAELRQPSTIFRKGNIDYVASDRLHFLRTALAAVLEEHSDGPLVREVLEDFNLTSANAGEAYRLEWQRFVDPELHPQMTPAERKEAVATARGNAQVMRLARVWKGVQALLAPDGPAKSGWLALASEPDDKEGGVKRVLHLKGRRDVKKGWQVPTLLLDATMNADLVRPYWPHLEVTVQLLAEAPHQHVRQVIDRAFSKSMLDPITPEMADTDPYVFRLLKADPKAPERRGRNLRRVHAILCREARRYAPERVLVVCQKAVKEALPAVGPLPVNVELAHHNAVAGRDEWGPQPDRPGVRALIVVGRTMPTIGAVERLAEALSGAAVEEITGGWFDRGDATREGLNGQAEAVETERHPNPVAEAIRWQICEGELVQIIGRGRGVNRTADNPVDILVLTDAPIPVPVAETINATDLDPTAHDMMAGAGGVVFSNARHASAAYPGLWATHKAAEHSLGRSPPLLYKYISLIEDWGTPRFDGIVGAKATYQVAGAGQKAAEVWFDPTLIPDIAVWLSGHLGNIAWCRVEGPPEPEPATTAALNPQTRAADVEELPMPLRLVVPAEAPREGIQPAAFYPVATDEGWEQMRPITSFVTLSGTGRSAGGHARHAIGLASLPRMRAQARALAEERQGGPVSDWLLPPGISGPPDWPPGWRRNIQEDLGQPDGRAA